MVFFKKIRYDKLSDVELIKKYSETDNSEYVGELFSRYSHLVYGVCLFYLKNRNESKDSVLDIFERLLKDLKTHDISNFKSWLHSVTRNYCLTKIRNKSRLSLREQIFSDQYENESTLQPDFDETNHEDFKKVYTAIQRLNSEQKKCIELFFLQNKSYAEIVEHTGFTSDQVKSYLQNGKRNLRNLLTNK